MKKRRTFLNGVVCYLSFFALGLIGCGGGDDGGDGDNKCQQLVEVASRCFSGWCEDEGAETPFCGCWVQGMDMSTACDCVTLNWAAACLAVPLDQFDPAKYDCDAATSYVADVCTGG